MRCGGIFHCKSGWSSLRVNNQPRPSASHLLPPNHHNLPSSSQHLPQSIFHTPPTPPPQQINLLCTLSSKLLPTSNKNMPSQWDHKADKDLLLAIIENGDLKSISWPAIAAKMQVKQYTFTHEACRYVFSCSASLVIPIPIS